MPFDMTAPSPTPVAQHSFACASCSQAAALVQLFGTASSGEVVRESFSNRSRYPVGLEYFERVRMIIVNGDAEALYEYDLEIASFYCPDCAASYCIDHWARWNVFDDEDGFDWHDSVRGRCPRGHQRMLED